MFKRKPSNNATVDTLIGPKTRIHGDVEFAGGFHLDGYINGNVTCDGGAEGFLSVSEKGCIDGSVVAPNVVLNGTVKGNIEAADRVELGASAKVLGNVVYTIIETAVGAQINGKLIHRSAASAAEGAASAVEGAVSSPEGAASAKEAPGMAEGEHGSQT